MVKNNLKNLLFIAILVAVVSSLSVYATSTYLFDSIEVKYNNSNSNLRANNVQDAVDELYTCVKDYTEVNDKISTIENNFLDKTYPVGSIYISVSNTNPSTLFGGTWEAFGTGKTLVGVNTSDSDFDTVEESHGSKTVTLSTSNLPSHSHYYTPSGTNSGATVGDHSYTPAGSINVAISDHSYTPAGSINVAISDHSYTPAGSINVAISDHSYTPAGSVSQPTFTGTKAQTEEEGSHSHLLNNLWSAEGGTGSRNVISGYPVSGSGQYAVVTDNSGAHKHYYTPAGTVSKPTFTGTKATLSHTVSTKTFTGTKATLSHTVSTKTFTGTKATLTHTVTQPTFTGTRSQTETAGSGTSFSTMNPYITVYMWKRIR